MTLCRCGFSAADIRRMTNYDAVAFADLASEGARKGGAPGPRKATQADIDRLLG